MDEWDAALSVKFLCGRVILEHIMVTKQEGFKRSAWPTICTASLNPISLPCPEEVPPSNCPQLLGSKIPLEVNAPISFPTYDVKKY